MGKGKTDLDKKLSLFERQTQEHVEFFVKMIWPLAEQGDPKAAAAFSAFLSYHANLLGFLLGHFAILPPGVPVPDMAIERTCPLCAVFKRRKDLLKNVQ